MQLHMLCPILWRFAEVLDRETGKVFEEVIPGPVWSILKGLRLDSRLNLLECCTAESLNQPMPIKQSKMVSMAGWVPLTYTPDLLQIHIISNFFKSDSG